jgi:DNA gyrase subunit B
MMRDGSYKRADELKSSDSLMPLYREINRWGYEKVYDPKENKYILTHRLVNEHFLGKLSYKIPREVIHHKGRTKDGFFDKRNNSPECLQRMTWAEHTKLHADLGWKFLHKEHMHSNPEFAKAHAERSSKRLKKQWETGEFKEIMANALNKVHEKNWADESYRSRMSNLAKEHMHKLHADPKFAEEHVKRSSERMKVQVRKFWDSPEYEESRNKMKQINKHT